MPLITREPVKEKRLAQTAAVVLAYMAAIVVMLLILEAVGAPKGLMDAVAGGASLTSPGVVWAAWRHFKPKPPPASTADKTA